MGLTAEGTVSFARNAINVAGTFIPAYSVNNLLRPKSPWSASSWEAG